MTEAHREPLLVELNAIAEAVTTLVEHMDQSLPADRVQALLDAADEQRRLARQRTIISIVSPLLVLAAVAYTSWTARESRDHQTEVAECIVEQFADHRDANRSAHQAFAAKLGAPYEVEPGHTPADAPDPNEACQRFIAHGGGNR